MSSSNFPRFDRNLNTGGNNYDEAKGVVAHNVVHHSKQYPSQVIGHGRETTGDNVGLRTRIRAATQTGGGSLMTFRIPGHPDPKIASLSFLTVVDDRPGGV